VKPQTTPELKSSRRQLSTPVAIVLSSFFVSAAILFADDISLGNLDVQGVQTDNVLNQGTPGTTPTPQQPQGKVEVSVDDDPMLGNKDAKVTIVEFSDFQCPFCKRLFDTTYPNLKKDYIDTGKVKLVYRDFPLDFHQNAHISAESAECADEQGKFWPYHDTLFAKQDEWGTLADADAKTKFVTYASSLGLNSGTFKSCLDSGKYKAEVDKDLTDGKAIGVTGTPTLVVNGTVIVGAQPYETFKAAIDAEL